MSEPIKTLKELFETLKAITGPIVVFGHAKADGDSIGSASGLVEILRAMGKDAVAMNPDPVPEMVQFIQEGIPWVETELKALEGKTAVIVDVADKKLLEGFSVIEGDLCIDHHAIRYEGVGKKEYVDSKAFSTCQILAEMARDFDLKVSRQGLLALYGGMISDTYRFYYGCGEPPYARSLRTAAWLVEQGINVQWVTEKLTNSMTREFLKFVGLAMSKAEFLENGKIVWVGISEEEMNAVGALYDDKNMLASMLCAIVGVEISAVVISRAGECFGSVRGKAPRYKVNELCKVFGGGGHDMAAGLRAIKEPLETFLPRFRAELLAHWKVYGSK